MRSGWRTRLAVGTVAALVVALTAAACDGGTVPVAQQSPVGETSTNTSATPSPTVTPEDPAVTADVCSLATADTASTTKLFNDQMAALEQAAARGDQAAMVAAAGAINKRFMSLGATLTQLATRPVSPALRAVLTDIATALAQMSSLAYTGTTVDIRKKLLDFAAAFAKVCAPATTASGSPSG